MISASDIPHTNAVGIFEGAACYPATTPYNPHEKYPEYPFAGHVSTSPNNAYAGVRDLFHLMGYDAANWGTPQWNPLGFLIKPGMTVVLKPNFVLSFHKKHADIYSIITHPSVLRAIADYCWIALQGSGTIIIADAPQYNCNFQQLLETTQLQTLADVYEKFAGPRFFIKDLRNYWSAGRHFPSMCKQLPGDPRGMTTVNLGDKSSFWGRDSTKYYGAVYHRQETIKHHSNDCHEYAISNTILHADVVISVPKLKVHKKVGVTLNAKGFVGTSTNKNLLVHYTLGTPGTGGDQFPDGFLKPHERFLIGLERTFYDLFLAKRSVFLEYIHRSLYAIHGITTRKLGLTVGTHKGYPKRIFDAGNWYGNDTAWRMTADLARILLFADNNGTMHTTPQRTIFSVVDGIIGGQGEGPLEPTPCPTGALLCGLNPIAVDLVATRLMGFDPMQIKIYTALLRDKTFDFGIKDWHDIPIISQNDQYATCLFDDQSRFWDYKPHPGWQGHIEVNPNDIERVL